MMSKSFAHTKLKTTRKLRATGLNHTAFQYRRSGILRHMILPLILLWLQWTSNKWFVQFFIIQVYEIQIA